MQKNTTSILFIITFILLIGCLPQIASDIYAPSLPAIADYFVSPTDHVQWSMALYMGGMAISLFFYGPLSDGIGRKWPLIIGLTIMLVGTLLCLFASSIEMLLIGRVMQGCGVGACALWRSIFRDVFSGDDLAKYASYFTLVVTFIMPAAPTVGGYLQQYFNWRASFVFLVVYTVLTLYIIIVHFTDTSEHHHPSHLTRKFIQHAFRHLFTNRIFVGYGICVLLTYGAFFAWFTIGPVILIEHANITPVQFGWLNFISGSCAMGLGGIMNARLVKRYGTHAMLQFGWGTLLVSGVLLIMVYAMHGIYVPGIMLCVFLLFFGSVFIWPNTFAGAMSPFAKIAGYAGTTYGALQLGGGALLGGVAAHVPDTNQVPFAIIEISCAIAAWLVYRCVVCPVVNKQQTVGENT